ncbi:MAG: hypothetical protein IKS55_15250 [Oscillospiraceae bacterium]|nr:hypothetical protein [Oscillospiraceae bacterium]
MENRKDKKVVLNDELLDKVSGGFEEIDTDNTAIDYCSCETPQPCPFMPYVCVNCTGVILNYNYD